MTWVIIAGRHTLDIIDEVMYIMSTLHLISSEACCVHCTRLDHDKGYHHLRLFTKSFFVAYTQLNCAIFDLNHGNMSGSMPGHLSTLSEAITAHFSAGPTESDAYCMRVLTNAYRLDVVRSEQPETSTCLSARHGNESTTFGVRNWNISFTTP